MTRAKVRTAAPTKATTRNKPMARQVELIVEDGTIVAGANSFVTEAEIVAYALARGTNLPHTTDEELDAVAVLGIKAMDYLAIQPRKGDRKGTRLNSSH